MTQEIKPYEVELEMCRKALEFYAAPRNWGSLDDGKAFVRENDVERFMPFGFVGGKKAREVLIFLDRKLDIDSLTVGKEEIFVKSWSQKD